MKLYGFPPSPNTWKVRAVAAYLGIPLEIEFVDLLKGASHTPAYLALNPTGRTPTLVDGDFKLSESAAIMQYIASKTANTLWPNDAQKRADIMRWQSWTLAHFSAEACQPLTFQRLVKKFLNLGPPDQAVVARATEAFNKEAKMLDAHLAKTGCHLGIGVGAFLDFVSGSVVRAPRWMNRLGIEWIFRLVQEPGRLWGRYVVGNPVFLWRAWRLRNAEVE